MLPTGYRPSETIRRLAAKLLSSTPGIDEALSLGETAGDSDLPLNSDDPPTFGDVGGETAGEPNSLRLE